MIRAAVAVVGALLFALPSSAAGQTNETAFSVERFTTAPGVGQFWTAEDATVLRHLAFSVGTTASVMSKPILFQDLNTQDRLTAPVKTRFGTELLAAVGLIDRLQLGVAVPFVAAQSGARLKGIDLDETELATSALGDLRLHVKARLTGRADKDGLSVALSANVSVPTGDQNHFSGEKSAVFQWLFVSSLRMPNWGVAFNMGQRLRGQKVVLLSPARPHDNEVVGALAGEAVLYKGLSAVAEVAFVTGATGPAPDVKGPSPGEMRAGLRLWVMPKLSVGVGAGFGTSPNQVGSPAWRGFATVSWASELERLAVSRR